MKGRNHFWSLPSVYFKRSSKVLRRFNTLSGGLLKASPKSFSRFTSACLRSCSEPPRSSPWMNSTSSGSSLRAFSRYELMTLRIVAHFVPLSAPCSPQLMQPFGVDAGS